MADKKALEEAKKLYEERVRRAQNPTANPYVSGASRSQQPTQQYPSSGQGGGSQQPSSGASTTPSALPPQKPPETPKVWMPFIDPRRAGEGKLSKGGDADLPDWLDTTLKKGFKDEFGGKKLQWGDLLPNVQDIFKPVARPLLTQEQTEEESGPQATLKELQAQQQKAQEYARQHLLQGTPLGKPDPNAPQGPSGVELLSAWLKSGETDVGKAVGGAVAGVPQTLMNLFNVPAQVTKQTIGTVEQVAGVDVNPAQMILGGQTIATLAKLGSGIAKLVGAEDIAAELEKHTDAPPSVTANLLANVIVRQREAGQDTTVSEGILNTLLDAQSVFTERPDAEAVIQRQSELIQASQELAQPGADAGAVWDASKFAYAGTEYELEARQRLEAGEDYDQVMADIDSKMSAQGRVQDLVGEMVLDPLNALDAVGGVTGLLGMGSRSERAAADAMRELVVHTDEGAGLIRIAATGGDVSRVGALEMKLRNTPIVGALLKPLPETIIARRGEEASAVIKMITQGISPEATSRLLSEGIDQHPIALAMEAFVNHNADDIAGTGKTADQIQELLGLSGRAMTPYECSKLNVPNGTFSDMFRSNAADRARDWLLKSGDDAQKLADEFSDMQKFYSETLLNRAATMLDEAGETVLVKGDDAIKLAEDKLITWLENVNKTYTKAAGVEEASGLYKKIIEARKGFAKIQGPFRFFHMGTNPGMAIRNWGNNVTVGWMDNFNLLTPIRSTQAEIGRLGLGGAGLARQLGGQTDVTKALRTSAEGGVKGFLKKIDPMEWSQHFEDTASQRVILQSFQKQMGESWRVGKAIPEDKFAELATYFPGKENELKALIEGAWAPGELQEVAQRMLGDDTWRNAARTSLNGTHDMNLANDLDELLKAAPNPEAAEELIQNYVQSSRDQWEDFIGRGVVMDGTPAAKALEAAQVAAKRLPANRRQQFIDEFTKQIVRQDATVALHKNYTKQALDILAKHDPKLAYSLQGRMLDLSNTADTVMDTYRPFQYDIFDAINNGDWERMRSIGDEIASKSADGFNPFQGVTNRSTAWDDYFQWSDEFWSEYRKSTVHEMKTVYAEAARAVKSATGTLPPVAPEKLLEQFLPLTTPEQRSLFAQIKTIARSRGIETSVELRDVLQKYNLAHANRIFRADIANRKWYESAVAAIFDWSSKEGPASKLIKGSIEEIDDSRELAYLMEKFNVGDVDSQVLNLADGMSAQMSERDAQIQKVLDALSEQQISRLSEGVIDQKTANKLNDFIREIEPRHVSTRAISEQVATKARDFALLNYSDQRGIDLLAGFMYNYPKWYMGSLKNMGIRALENPGRMASLIKLRQNIRDMNRDLPEWWQDQLSIPLPDGGQMFFNALGTIDPLNGFLGDKFRDPNLQNDPLSKFFSEAQQYGPGLHGTWASLMALRAMAMGDREASMGWVGSLGPATKGITALTALAKEYIPGMDFIPSGGVVVEPWLWGSGNLPGQGMQMIGTQYDAKRIGRALADLAREGATLADGTPVTYEMAYEAMLSQNGELFDMALQQSKIQTSRQVLASWLFGASIKGRNITEIEIQRMDADRMALVKARDEGYYDGHPELWRQAWEKMRENYPWMDFVQGFRRDETGRANIYAMSVYDRLPPNPRPYIEALMGGETEIYNELLDKFYGGEAGQKPCSIENMTKSEQEMFMSMMQMMGTVLALPDTATSQEWNMARQARSAMYQRLNGQYNGIEVIQDQYFALLNSGSENAAKDARAYLDQHGELQAYWDDKDQIVASDPLLSKYWGSMQMFERVARDEFERRMATKYPGLSSQIDEYYRLRDEDPDKASEYLKAHPNVTAYWDDKNEWTINLDDELRAMSGSIGNLEGQWGQLRQDIGETTLGEQRVVDLIESGTRPMGDFELPESLDAKQTQAHIQQEIDKYLETGSWGNLYNQLRAMGGLDKTLTAYQEFARGSVDTIEANKQEVKALLAALASMNEGKESGTQRTRIVSQNYGGASQKSLSKAQQKQQDQQIDLVMQQVQQSQPRYWGTMQTMISMNQQQIGELLEKDAGFRAFLDHILQQTGFNIEQLIAYFKRMR